MPKIFVGERSHRKFWGRCALAMCLAPSMPWKGESGWSEMQRIAGFNSFKRRVVPTNVPLVPIMETKCVTRPSVCCQISLAVPW